MEEVQNIFDLVDDDKNGHIDFQEFLNIIVNKNGKQLNQKISNFFQSFSDQLDQ